MAWEPITCRERDDIYRSRELFIWHTRTLAVGLAAPEMDTQWEAPGVGLVLRDTRYPSFDPHAQQDAEPCKHYRWVHDA